MNAHIVKVLPDGDVLWMMDECEPEFFLITRMTTVPRTLPFHGPEVYVIDPEIVTKTAVLATFCMEPSHKEAMRKYLEHVNSGAPGGRRGEEKVWPDPFIHDGYLELGWRRNR